jgi:uncharacterized protein (DUF1778 family)
MEKVDIGVKTMSDKKRLINFAEEYDRIITEAARRSGLSFSAFCRSAALEKAATIVEHIEQPRAD